MTDDDLCPHDIDPRWCATCLHGPRPRPEPVHIVKLFRANFAGDCGECSTPIDRGQLCAKLSNGKNVHAGCQP